MKNLVFLFAVIVIISCNNDAKKNGADISQYATFSKDGQFSLAAPKYMKSSSGLNPDASLQLENREKEVYLALIEEPKDEVVRNFKITGVYNDSLSPIINYLNVQINSFTRGLKISEKGKPQAVEINDMPAINLELVAQPSQVDVGIYYLITFFEGEDQLYMLMQWTVDSQKEMYEETFLTIAETFKEE